MRSHLLHKILSLILAITLVTSQFMPGFAAALHAEEGGDGASTSQESEAVSSESQPDTGTSEASESEESSSSEEEESESSGDPAEETESHVEPETAVGIGETATDSSENSTGDTPTEESTENTPSDLTPDDASDTSAGTSTETPTTDTPAESNSASTSSAPSASTTDETAAESEEEAIVATSTQETSTSISSSGSLESHSTTTPGSIATTSPETSSSATSTPTATSSPSLTATTTATSTSVATSTPEIDDDEATTTPITSTSTPTILSGQAVAMANILNILNANMINSEGAILLSNFFDDQYGTLDLRGTGSGACGLSTCTTGGIQVNLLNTAEIANSIQVTATSGQNIIDGAGDGTIQTGDAYAGLNLVNVANTNFIDSRYLLVSLNAFRNINGDIVFPSLASFFTSLNPSAATQHINNGAEVNNDVSVTANAGNNTAHTASSTIATGDAISTSNVFNSINTNLSGGNTLHILLRVHGEWIGDILGAPDDFQALRTNSSLLLTNGGTGAGSDTVVNATNTSVIRNTVDVTADTGNNEVRNASSSLIHTGDAYAAANILNVANANVVGRNWMLAIINIFGDFKGNVSFGRPDLWVGEQISAPSKVENGSELEYKFTIINNGDLAATQVVLRDAFDEHVDVESSSHTFAEDGGYLVWNIGTLPPGGATEITYRGKVSGARPGTKIENVVTVRGAEPDDNLEDNTDTAHVWTAERIIKVKREKEEPVAEEVAATTTQTSTIDDIQVSRRTMSSVVKNIGTKAPQELVVSNPTNHPVRSVMLRDIMRDPDGQAVQTEEWMIGDLLPHEEVIITYDIQFGGKAKPGTYLLSTTLSGAASTTRTLALNGTVTLLEPVPVIAAFVPKKVEASVNTSTVPVIEDDAETTTPVDTANLVAAAADTGYNFNLWWLILLLTGTGLIIAGRKLGKG